MERRTQWRKVNEYLSWSHNKCSKQIFLAFSKTHPHIFQCHAHLLLLLAKEYMFGNIEKFNPVAALKNEEILTIVKSGCCFAIFKNHDHNCEQTTISPPMDIHTLNILCQQIKEEVPFDGKLYEKNTTSLHYRYEI